MSIKTDALTVLNGIDMLADAFYKAKGHKMEVVTVTKKQEDFLRKAMATDKLHAPDLNLGALTYKGIVLKIQGAETNQEQPRTPHITLDTRGYLAVTN